MDNHYNYNKYEQYLLSEAWKQKRKQRLKIDNYKCQMCGCTGTMNNRLTVHHFTYHNLFNEDVEKDLVTLCQVCHKSVHRMMNRITDTRTMKHGWKDTISAYVDHVEREADTSLV